MKQCPKCSATVSTDTWLCDCGYEFDGSESKSPASESGRSESFLRLARSWLLLPIVAWLLAIPCLGAGAFFVPIVIANAPLGIIGYFQEITVNPTDEQAVAISAIHAGFWLLFIIGTALRHKLPLVWLLLIWLTLVTALFMSVSGCAVQLGPGLRNEGNWH